MYESHPKGLISTSNNEMQSVLSIGTFKSCIAAITIKKHLRELQIMKR
jgi:hypothetical protein